MFMMQPSAAQQKGSKGLRLNHVGMYVKNFDESMNFYTKTMGFREAFSFNDKEGKPTLTYLQINRDTFLELAPATAVGPVAESCGPVGRRLERRGRCTPPARDQG